MFGDAGDGGFLFGDGGIGAEGAAGDTNGRFGSYGITATRATRGTGGTGVGSNGGRLLMTVDVKAARHCHDGLSDMRLVDAPCYCAECDGSHVCR